MNISELAPNSVGGGTLNFIVNFFYCHSSGVIILFFFVLLVDFLVTKELL